MSFRLLTAAALVAAVPLTAATAATAPAPAAATFVKKAGASDLFEIDSAKVMAGSTNPQIKQFAQQMITDHTKSTAMVKAAAQKAGLTVSPPTLDAMQTSNLAKLKAAKGTARDTLYISQQKAAHAQALALMQSEAAGGKPAPLKDAASQIVPVVQGHIDMLNQMPAA